MCEGLSRWSRRTAGDAPCSLRGRDGNGGGGGGRRRRYAMGKGVQLLGFYTSPHLLRAGRTTRRHCRLVSIYWAASRITLHVCRSMPSSLSYLFRPQRHSSSCGISIRRRNGNATSISYLPYLESRLPYWSRTLQPNTLRPVIIARQLRK